jgi:hypothetical protein
MTDSRPTWPLQQVDLNYERAEISLPDLYVSFEIQVFPTKESELTMQGISELSGYELGIWLRHASSKVAHIGGQSTCRLETPPGIEIGSPLAENGVHEPGSCANGETGCVIHDAFGPGLHVDGQVTSREIYFPTKSSPWSASPTSAIREAPETDSLD